MFQSNKLIFLLILLAHWTLVYAHSRHSSGLAKGKYFDRVVIIVLENQNYDVAAKDKYLSKLISKYKSIALTNYLATTHPSQPNYISMISGSTKGTKENDESNIDRKTIIDLLEAKGVSWKTYQEDYPGNCNLKMDIKGYARKHNPFISFKNIQKNKSRCAKIVNSKQLDTDIKNNDVPQFVFYTPNIDNDAHDTNMAYVTFDEDDGASRKNKVLTILFGPDFHTSSNKKDSTQYTHYSLLRTIEDNWNLGDLGQNDKNARKIKL